MRGLMTTPSATSNRCPQTLVREWHRLACCASATSKDAQSNHDSRRAQAPNTSVTVVESGVRVHLFGRWDSAGVRLFRPCGTNQSVPLPDDVRSADDLEVQRGLTSARERRADPRRRSSPRGLN